MKYSALHIGRTSSFGLLLLVASLFLASFAFAQPGGGAVTFQNSNYLNHGDFGDLGSPDYSFGNQITVAAWVKWTMVPGSYLNMFHESGEGKWANLVTIDKHNMRDNGQFWLQHTTSNNRFQWGVQTTNGRTLISSTTSPEIAKWYYLTGVYDADDATARMKFYVNGMLEATSNIQTGSIAAHSALDRLSFARLPNGYRLFTGMLDEVRIWKSALTETEIRAQMYAKETQGSNLASYWPLDATSGTALADQGAQAASGTYYTALVDVHSFNASSMYVNDDDKNWTANEFQNMTVVTVAGTGVGETSTVASNTGTRLTFSTWGTDPVIDDFGVNPNSSMTWYGVENPAETSQWVASTAPIASTGSGGDLEGRLEIRGINTSKTTSYASSILTLSSSNLTGDDYVVFGHDTGSLSHWGATVPAGIHHRLARVWTVEARVSGSKTGTLTFDVSTLDLTAGQEGKLRLLEDADGDFTNANMYSGTYSAGTFTISNVSFTNGMQYTIGSIDASNPLPVELAAFTARVRQSDILLDWETISEKNNYGFNVEKALENSPQTWHEIGFVEGNGTVDTRKQYRFVDNALPVGKAYYRLKQIDRDGTFAYSDIATVTGSAAPLASLLTTFPNPVRGAATISFVTSRETPVTVTVHNMLGRCVLTLCDNRLFASGTQSLQFNATGLQPGSYVLQLRSSDGTLARPLLIAR